MRQLLCFILIGAVVILSGCATHQTTGIEMSNENNVTGFVTKTMSIKDEQRIYVVYVPQDYSPKEKWPLIVALHGIGERGNDGLLQTEVGIGRAIRRHADRFPCIVVMPQCSPKRLWTGSTEDIETAIAETRAAYTIDPDRIYLTGLSMGGFGTWMYGADHIEMFAAMIPICGGGRIEDAPKLATVPIWVFHGAADKTVSPKKSRDMVEAVEKAGGNIKYTEFPGVGHNSWDNAYGNPKTIKWLLEQRKK